MYPNMQTTKDELGCAIYNQLKRNLIFIVAYEPMQFWQLIYFKWSVFNDAFGLFDWIEISEPARVKKIKMTES